MALKSTILLLISLFIALTLAADQVSVSCKIDGETTTYVLQNETVTTVNGTRDFLYYEGDRPIVPGQGVIMYLHGGTETAYGAAGASTDCLWLSMANRTRQLMVFPNGQLISPSDPTKGRTWNACLACNRSSICPPGSQTDDVNYISQIANWANTQKNTASDRVYVAGSSLGGLMVERLALELSEQITAGASLLTDLPVTNDTANKGYDTVYKCKGYKKPYPSTRMVPMFLFKGDKDFRLEYGSDDPADFANQSCQYVEQQTLGNDVPPCQLGALYQFKRTVAFWQWKLGIAPSPEELQQPDSFFAFQDVVPSFTMNQNTTCDVSQTHDCDGSRMVRFNYGSSTPNYKLIWYRGVGAGHTFPGPSPQTAGEYTNAGYKNRDPLVGVKYIVEDIATFFQHWTTTTV